MTRLRARFSLHTIISLPAVPWAVTVPGSLPPTRQKRGRGLHLPAPSPGGIASQNCRLVVHRDDGASVSHLVRTQSRGAHPVALGAVLCRRSRTAPAARRRPEISV